jgi:hypothetical protein
MTKYKWFDIQLTISQENLKDWDQSHYNSGPLLFQKFICLLRQHFNVSLFCVYKIIMCY